MVRCMSPMRTPPFSVLLLVGEHPHVHVQWLLDQAVGCHILCHIPNIAVPPAIDWRCCLRDGV
jgi:hypothetical protein